MRLSTGSPFRSIIRAQIFHRKLFTFPGLSDLPRWSPETQKYHERKIFPYVRLTTRYTNLAAEHDTIRYKQEQLYEIVADVGSYPQFVPFCTGSRLLRPAPRRAQTTPFVMEAELTVGFLSFNESYVSQVTCHPYHSVEVYVIYAINRCLTPQLGGRFVVHTLIQNPVNNMAISASIVAISSSVERPIAHPR
jgi:Polyketide cyclase / dehydrase and lipid transport